MVFKPLAPYSWEENDVSERTERTIIDMIQAIILKKDINNILGLEIVLVITYVKNLQLTRALKDSMNPIKMQDQALLTLHDV